MAFTHYLNVDTLDSITKIVRDAGYRYLPDKAGIDEVVYPGSGNPWNRERPKWFPGIKREVVRKNHVEVRSPDLILIKCSHCGFWNTASGIQIDHIGGYEKIIDQCCPDPTNLEARIAYNKLGPSLQARCSFCNGSHPESKPVAMGTRNSAANYVRDKIKEYVDGTVEGYEQ